MVVNVLLITNVTIKSTRKDDIYIGNRVNEFIEYYNNYQGEKVEIKLNHMGLMGALYNLDDLDIKNYVLNQEKEFETEGYFFKY